MPTTLHPNLYYEEIHRPGVVQKTANCVLWDPHTGDPFFMPPGREPMLYVAKGFRMTPPKGWKAHPDRPVAKPVEPTPEEPWEPDGYRSPLQEEYDRTLSVMEKARLAKEKAAEFAGGLNERLIDVLENLAPSKGKAKAKGK